MLVLRGAAALSRFRLQKLSERLQTAVGANLRIASSFMHFIDTEGELSPRQSEVLAQLVWIESGASSVVWPTRSNLTQPGRNRLLQTSRRCCTTA
jgi:hypothetical protein